MSPGGPSNGWPRAASRVPFHRIWPSAAVPRNGSRSWSRSRTPGAATCAAPRRSGDHAPPAVRSRAGPPMPPPAPLRDGAARARDRDVAPQSPPCLAPLGANTTTGNPRACNSCLTMSIVTDTPHLGPRSWRLCVAPMMDWTLCQRQKPATRRFELRLLQSSRRAVASEWLAMSASRSLQVLPVHMRAKLSS
jgi:hypothetical protein